MDFTFFTVYLHELAKVNTNESNEVQLCLKRARKLSDMHDEAASIAARNVIKGAMICQGIFVWATRHQEDMGKWHQIPSHRARSLDNSFRSAVEAWRMADKAEQADRHIKYMRDAHEDTLYEWVDELLKIASRAFGEYASACNGVQDTAGYDIFLRESRLINYSYEHNTIDQKLQTYIGGLDSRTKTRQSIDKQDERDSRRDASGEKKKLNQYQPHKHEMNKREQN